MSDLEYLPKETTIRRTSASFSSDEKQHEKEHDNIEVISDVHGEVYDDIRDIDLGEDGKEKPIGMSCSLTPTFLSLNAFLSS